MKVEKALGCYGYVTTYNDESEHCRQCPLRKSCRLEAYRSLKKISAEIDVTNLMGRFADLFDKDKDSIRLGIKAPKNRRNKLKQYAQTKDQALLVMTLPVKQRRLITSLNKKGIPLRNLIRAGSNPFSKHKPAFMRVPCRMIIECGRFTRRELKDALMVEYPHWSDATAESHTSIAVGVLVALRVIQKTDNTYSKVDD